MLLCVLIEAIASRLLLLLFWPLVCGLNRLEPLDNIVEHVHVFYSHTTGHRSMNGDERSAAGSLPGYCVIGRPSRAGERRDERDPRWNVFYRIPSVVVVGSVLV